MWRIGVRMGGVGCVWGKVPRGSEAEAFAWWRSGCLGWSLGVQDRGCLGRKQRSVHHAGCYGEETKARSIATGGHACRDYCVGSSDDQLGSAEGLSAGVAFLRKPHEHATALAHAARDPRAGLSRGGVISLVAAVRLRMWPPLSPLRSQRRMGGGVNPLTHAQASTPPTLGREAFA